MSIMVSQVYTLYSVVFAQAAIASKPSKRALHNPSQSGNLEGALASFHDSQAPAVIAKLPSELPAFMSSVGNTIRMPENSGLKPLSSKDAARRSDVLAGSTLLQYLSVRDGP